MGFFEFAEVVTSQEEIRSRVSIDTLPDFCEEIEGVDAAEELGLPEQKTGAERFSPDD